MKKEHEWLFQIKRKPFDPKSSDYSVDILYMQCVNCRGQVVWWKAPKDTVIKRPVKDGKYCDEA